MCGSLHCRYILKWNEPHNIEKMISEGLKVTHRLQIATFRQNLFPMQVLEDSLGFEEHHIGQ